MTDLQIKYQTLLEQQRANQEQEHIKWKTLSETQRSNRMQESLKHEMNVSDIKLNEAQRNKLIKDLDVLNEQVSLIKAQTGKTKAEMGDIIYKEYMGVFDRVYKALRDMIGDSHWMQESVLDLFF